MNIQLLNRSALAGCLLLFSACSGNAGLYGQDGVSYNVTTGAISIDKEVVPVLVDCREGEVVRRLRDGWECVTPRELPVLNPGDGISIRGGSVSVDFGSGDLEAARGNHNHDSRYRLKDDPISWSSIDPLSVPNFLKAGDITQYTDDDAKAAVEWDDVRLDVQAGDVWPGIISASQIPDLPSPTWTKVGSSVLANDYWPGRINYSHIDNAPAITWNTISNSVDSNTNWPGKVAWDNVKGSVTSTTDWPGKVAWDNVKGSVTSTTDWTGKVSWNNVKDVITATDWPGTIDYSRVTNKPSNTITWDNIKPSVTSTTEWPGQVSFGNVKDVSSGTEWPGTIPSTRVSGLPDTTMGTVYQYATYDKFPPNPPDGLRVYLQSNTCTYQYSSTNTRWEVVSCDYYPDWLGGSSTTVVTFVAPDGSSVASNFANQIADGAVTRDFLYGLNYADNTAGYFLVVNSSSSDDTTVVPTRIRGRWQRCAAQWTPPVGNSFSIAVNGKTVCLPYLGMIRDTVSNNFEADWFRIGTRTYTGGRTIATTASASPTDYSLVSVTPPPATAYFLSSYIYNGYTMKLSPWGTTSTVYCESGNTSGSGTSSTNTVSCVIPQPPTSSKTRGFRILQNYTTINVTLFWYDESR